MRGMLCVGVAKSNKKSTRVIACGLGRRPCARARVRWLGGSVARLQPVPLSVCRL